MLQLLKLWNSGEPPVQPAGTEAIRFQPGHMKKSPYSEKRGFNLPVELCLSSAESSSLHPWNRRLLLSNDGASAQPSHRERLKPRCLCLAICSTTDHLVSRTLEDHHMRPCTSPCKGVETLEYHWTMMITRRKKYESHPFKTPVFANNIRSGFGCSTHIPTAPNWPSSFRGHSAAKIANPGDNQMGLRGQPKHNPPLEESLFCQ